MLGERSHSAAELGKLTGFDRRTIAYYIQQGLIPRPGRRGPNTRYPEETLLRLRFIRGVKDLQNRGELLNLTLNDIRDAMDRAGTDQLRALVYRGLPAAEVEPLLAGPPSADTPVPGASHSADAPADAAPLADPVPAAGRPAPSPPPGERRAFGLADAGVRQRFAAGSRPKPSTSPAPPVPVQQEPTGPGPARPQTAAQPRGATPPPAAGATAAAASEATEDSTDLGELLRALEVRPGLAGRRLPPGASEQWTEIPITTRVFLSVRGLSDEDAPLANAVARALKKLLRAR